jgi:hypothetical protein
MRQRRNSNINTLNKANVGGDRISTHPAYFRIEEAPAQNGFPTQFSGENNSPAFFSALAEMK